MLSDRGFVALLTLQASVRRPAEAVIEENIETLRLLWYYAIS